MTAIILRCCPVRMRTWRVSARTCGRCAILVIQAGGLHGAFNKCGCPRAEHVPLPPRRLTSTAVQCHSESGQCVELRVAGGHAFGCWVHPLGGMAKMDIHSQIFGWTRD